MRRIAFITGSRGEWGYIRPIIRIIENNPNMDYQIIATNMHVLPQFGYSVNEIEQDGFNVAEKIYMTYDGYTSITMAKSLGSLLMELPTTINRLKPDIILLAGDRGEQLIGAIVGVHLGIPVAHIQAGELSGNVDGIIRHAITKLAHIHFAANDEFAERVKKLGEEDFRIFTTGAPLVDEIVNGKYTSESDVRIKYRINNQDLFVLAVQHPVTEEEDFAGDQVEKTIEALIEIGWPAIFIYPNADAGSELIRSKLSKLKKPNIRLFRNLPRQDYLGLLRIADVMVGNSSSGVMEAPSFSTPAVNIGRRQHNRLQASNVINVTYDTREIVDAIRKAVTPEFIAIARESINPYGDGMASPRIVEILQSIEINEKLMQKEMAY
jgi:GDP/UDP-N,N'-diacetylbacillosamine 2-epimerase (hydrolysing)